MTRWTVTEVSQATGLSEGAISGYFSNKKISTKNGIDLGQIMEVLKAPRRDNKINDITKVKKLVIILQAAGFETPYTYQAEQIAQEQQTNAEEE